MFQELLQPLAPARTQLQVISEVPSISSLVLIIKNLGQVLALCQGPCLLFMKIISSAMWVLILHTLDK